MNDRIQTKETLPERRFVLPDSWIERLFDRLSALYGVKFLDMWKGTDLANVKQTWAEKLGGFCDRPEIIRDALDACDDRPFPPTLPEFMGACRDAARRIGTISSSLPAPDLSPDERAARTEQIVTIINKTPAYDFKLWAKQLRAEYLSGVILFQIQIDNASAALGEVWKDGQCLPRVSA